MTVYEAKQLCDLLNQILDHLIKAQAIIAKGIDNEEVS